MSQIQIGRLVMGPPLQWYEQMGDPITNLGGAIVPSPRTALRHAVTVPTLAGDGLTDTVAARLTIRQQLRSMLNNSAFKLQGYCYLLYADDPEQNGWFVPDQGQLSDIDGSSGLSTGAWKLDNVNWAMVGHRRTHREARNIWMRNLTTGLSYRDTLRLVYSTDFSGLANNGSPGALGLTILPAGATEAADTVTGQVYPLTQQVTGRDGGAAMLTAGSTGTSPIPDLATVSYERAESSWGLSDVICYDRRGDISAPSTGPASDWVEVYGSDFPWNWLNSSQVNDAPVLDNGLVRVRYDASQGYPGFKVDVWNGSAYVEQGKMCVYRNGDYPSYCDTFVSAGLHLDNGYTPDKATAAVVLAYSGDPYSRERVFITVARGQPSVTFECYPAPELSSSPAAAWFTWQTAVADANDSAMVVTSEVQTSAILGPAAGNSLAVLTAGSGSALFTTSSFGTAFSGENTLTLLRCSATATLAGYQTNFAVVQYINAHPYVGHGAIGYTVVSNTVTVENQPGLGGYLSVDLGFSPTAAQQVLEAEAMTSTGTVVSDASASGGQAVKFTASGTLTKANWPSGQPGVYRVFARCEATGTGGTIEASTSGTGGTTGSTVSITEQTTPVYTWYDLGEVLVPSATSTLTLTVAVSTGRVQVDRIEAYLMTERVSPARYAGARDFGQSVLYDSRALGAVVSR